MAEIKVGERVTVTLGLSKLLKAKAVMDVSLMEQIAFV